MAFTIPIADAFAEQLRVYRVGIEISREFGNRSPTFTHISHRLQALSEETELLRQSILSLPHISNTPSEKLEHIRLHARDAADRSTKIADILSERAHRIRCASSHEASRRDLLTVQQLLGLLDDVESQVNAAKVIARVLTRCSVVLPGLDDPLPVSEGACGSQGPPVEHIHKPHLPDERLGQQGHCSEITVQHSDAPKKRRRPARHRKPKLEDLCEANKHVRLSSYPHHGNTTVAAVGACRVLEAASNGHVTELEKLLKEDPRRQKLRDANSVGLMGLAIARGQLGIVRFLLENGYDVNERFGLYRSTPLSEALRCRQYPITKLLLDHGADLSSRNNFGKTPIYSLWSLESNQASTAFLKLLRNHKDWLLLHENVYDHDGWPVIAHASCYGHKDDLTFLISSGLNPLAVVEDTGQPTGHEGWSSLGLAAWYGAFESVKILARSFYLAQLIDHEDRNGCTALHYAVHRNMTDIAKCLLLLGADPFKQANITWIKDDHISPNKGHTALSLLCETNVDFQAQFLTWMFLVQLPCIVIPGSMRIPRIIPFEPVEASTLPQLVPPLLGTLPTTEILSAGHSYGHVSSHGGTLHQGDRNIGQYIGIQNVTNVCGTVTLGAAQSILNLLTFPVFGYRLKLCLEVASTT